MHFQSLQLFVCISFLSVIEIIFSTAVEKSAILKIKNALHNFSLNRTSGEPSSHFADIQNSIVWNISDTHFSDGSGQSSKYFVYSNEIKRRGKDFIVYSAGNNNEIGFEMTMSELGAKVFSFDCTVKMQPSWAPHFDFHEWCIGESSSFETSIDDRNLNKSNLIFKSLSTVMKELQHTHIDIFKFDIEGFEWGLIERELINGKNLPSLPKQLLFELHCEGSNPKYVPEHLTRGKTREQVDKMFLGLYHRGYRVVNWELNSGDSNCAEFTMVLAPSS